MHVGLSGFLYHAGSFIRFVRLHVSQKDFMCCSSIPTLKSSKINIFLYFEECKSKKLLNVARWFFIMVL